MNNILLLIIGLIVLGALLYYNKEEGVELLAAGTTPWRFTDPRYDIKPSYEGWDQVVFEVDIMNVSNAAATKYVSVWVKRADVDTDNWKEVYTAPIAIASGEMKILAIGDNEILTTHEMSWEIFAQDSDGYKSDIIVT